MYIWGSELLRQYGNGLIIVEAVDIQEAREKAKNNLMRWIEENRGWTVDDARNGDSEELDNLINLFNEDISKDPIVQEVSYVSGSQ